MKSIKLRIRVVVLLLVLISSLLIGTITALLNAYGIDKVLTATAGPVAKITANAVKWRLDDYWAPLTEAAALSEFKELVSTDPELIAITEGIASRNGYIYVGKMDRNGIASTGENYGNTEYFLKCKESLRPVISDLMNDGNQMIFLLEVPILVNNQFEGVVYGAVNADFLTDIVSGLNLGENGQVYVLDANGNVIGHPNRGYVTDGVNIIDQAKTDSSMEDVAAVHSLMMNGETGITSYRFDGDNKCFAYTPVGGEQGWSVGVEISQSEFKAALDFSILMTIAILIIIIAVASVVTFRFAKSIADPLRQIQEAASNLSEGILDTEIAYQSQDELGQLADHMRTAQTDLKSYISDFGRGIAGVASGDLTVRPNVEYKGDFVALKEHMMLLIERLNDTLGQIDRAAETVSMSASNVSNGSQMLSEGANEQTVSVDKLSDGINDISDNIKDMAKHAEQASVRANDVGEEMRLSNDKMIEMVHAMEEISKSSGEIGKIIKTIEDIAFQTNILALNAAVEAARAGAAGKGFSVVADEVRNLAGKSAEASKNTTSLIERSMIAVENGRKVADETAKSLSVAVEGASEIISSIGNISATATNQSSFLNQVEQGIEQISTVVQTNAATAEENAASSEELSGQAELLKQLVTQYKLSE